MCEHGTHSSSQDNLSTTQGHYQEECKLCVIETDPMPLNVGDFVGFNTS